MNWDARIEVMKGNAGEQLVDQFLRGKGVIPYVPVAQCAHPFDRLCATADKRTIFIADVKSKARRVFYPDTGIEERHYRDYLRISEKHRLKVFLFFVDHLDRQIYGNWLAELSKPRTVSFKQKTIQYPLHQHGIVYFPVEAMRQICELTEEQVQTLTDMTRWAEKYTEAFKQANSPSDAAAPTRR